MFITANEAKHNVKIYKKEFGTSNLEKILKEIECKSKRGFSEFTLGRFYSISGLNKKDYYLLKQNGFNIRFSATYDKERISECCTEFKTREISLHEYFCNNSLEDKEVVISWN